MCPACHSYLWRSDSRDTTTRQGVSDTDYTVTSRDTIVAITALTAPRTITLPDPTLYPGKNIIIKDESGACSLSNTITISGVIDGGQRDIECGV
ncbi:MAG: hypothetical protein WDN27_00875 [Candidatus Saccharibacteria bacterium]